ncbi:MAG: iron ABC transporter permease [Chloroflexi bacterium]|nr:iron ABC transporter permease [Chloroflexota bacterium]MEC7836477.1 iron ABC transporter permease [Chloroflexota bacterium]
MISTKSLPTKTSLWILIPSLIAAALCVTPLIYLIGRVSGADYDVWAWLIRPKTLLVFSRSIFLAITVALLSVAIAVPITWLTTRTNLPYKKLWSVLTFLPLVIPSYVGAYILLSFVGNSGLLYKILNPALGVSQVPTLYGYYGSLITLSFLNYPYIILTIRSNISNMDASGEETAKLMGLNQFQTFMKVTLPSIKPAILSGALLVTLYTLSDFGAVSLLRYKTFTWSIFNQYEAGFDRNTAALLSLALFSVATLFMTFEIFIRGDRKYYKNSSNASKKLSVIDIGRWRWPAAVACALVSLVSVVIPLVVLSYWIVRGLYFGEDASILTAEPNHILAFNSITLSIFTAAVVVILSLPVGYLSIRRPSILTNFVEKMCFTGYALPSIAVSLSLVFFGAKIGAPLYQSTLLLVIACAILYMPTGLGAIRSSMAQISPRYEESSMTLGKNKINSVLRTNLPLMKSGIIMAAATVFLITMKELPAVLLLAPLDFHTLTTAIWSLSSEAFFAKAAIPSLLLIFLSSIPLTMIVIKNSVFNNLGSE